MRLKVSYARGDGTITMLELRIAAGTSVNEAARDLFSRDATRRGQEPPADLTMVVTAHSTGGAEPRSLDRHRDLDAAGLCSGDHIVLAPASHAAPPRPADPEAIATVTAGPDRGSSFALHAGSNTVGRDTDVAVLLTDPLVSSRHARIVVGDHVEVIDTGSTNGVLVGDAFVTRARLLDGETLRVGATEIAVARATPRRPRTTPPPRFTRSPRVVPPLVDEVLDLPEPPARPQPRQFPRMALLAPVALGLTMYIATGRLVSLVFVAMAPLMMVGSHVDGRVSASRLLKRQSAEFRRSLGVAEQTLAARHTREREARMAHAPAVAEVLAAVRERGALLWTRRPEHEAFLTVRLGLGSVPACATAAMPAMRDSPAELWEEAERVCAQFAAIDESPVTADLRACGAMGIAGAWPHAESVARAVLAQIAGLHSPAECVVAAFVSPIRARQWRWLEWLPHVSCARSPLSGSHLAHTAADSHDLLGRVEGLVSGRAGQDIAQLVAERRGTMRSSGGDHGSPSLPALVVLVCDDSPADRARLIRVAEAGADVSVHVVWVAQDGQRVPAACRTVVTSRPDTASVGHVRTGSTAAPVGCEGLTVEEATDMARRMAGVEDAGMVVDGDTSIPGTVAYLDLHGFDALDPRRHCSRWAADAAGPGASEDGGRASQPFSLRALVGHDGREPFYLDLATQGPHALVAGTTGAGKSEFLQSWILAMAMAHSPRRVTFLLVDYKGGSAFAECAGLPHTVGMVTDLTPRLADRALASLRAELRLRERLLAAKGAKDLETLARSGDPGTPPSLVIVIDEFAALVREVPTFVDGVVDIGQRGRSLGLHLIMATQRPAGVIKDSLRANTNLRIALRLADEADSTDVVGAAAAAHLDAALPGRALARSGPGRVTAFQAAYAGAHSAPRARAAPLEVRELVLGHPRRWAPPAREQRPAHGPTDAARVAAAVDAASHRLAVPPPRRPWLDELGSTYDLAALVRDARGAAAFGLDDDPALQAQNPATFDPDRDGAVLVLGGAGAGKSTALRSIALGLVLAAAREPVHLYGIDGGGGGLEGLGALPTTADVVDIDDSERVGRMLVRLAGEIDARTRRFAAARVTSLAELRADAGPDAPPRILLLIDGFGAFQAEYQNDPARQACFRRLTMIMAEGRAVGVHVVLSADRLGALHTSVQSLVGRSLVLRMPDAAQYGLMGLRGVMPSADAPPGRGVDAATGREFQIGVLGADPHPRVQARRLEELAAQMPSGSAWRPAPIPSMPSMVPAAGVPEHLDGLPVLGVDGDSLELRSFDLDRPIALAGPAGSGRASALAWMATAIRRAHPDRTLVLLSQRPTRIGGLSPWDSVHVGAAAGDEVLDRWGERLSRPASDDGQVVLCIQGVQDFGVASGDGALLQAVRAARRNGHLIIGEAELQGWTGGPLAAEIKGARRGLLLAPDGADCQMIFGAQAPRSRRGQAPPGRGVWVESGRVAEVQIPWLDDELSTDRGGGLRPMGTPR